MKKLRLSKILLVLLQALLLVGCDASDKIPAQRVDSQDRLTDSELFQLQQRQPHTSNNNSYTFGFELRASPQEDAAQYLSFLKYLENATGYHFKLHFTPKSSSTVNELGHNKVQFAAMGSFGYLKAQSKYAVVMLARGVNQQNKAKYRSAFIVNPESSIQNIQEIKDKKMAFGNPDSTQGYLLPRITLIESGISLQDLQFYEFTGSHQRCAETVVANKFDVCGMQDTLARILVDQGMVRIIQFSAFYPSSGIVVNDSVPEKVIQKVKQALLDFDPEGKHRHYLYHWDRTEMPKGFTVSNESDFAKLRYWTKQFGLLKGSQSQR